MTALSAPPAPSCFLTPTPTPSWFSSIKWTSFYLLPIKMGEGLGAQRNGTLITVPTTVSTSDSLPKDAPYLTHCSRGHL